MAVTPGVTELNSLVHAYVPRTYGSFTVGYSAAYGLNARTRTFRVHLPKRWVSTKKYPLVLCFHGGRSGGEDQEEMTKMSTYADKYDFVAVYPDGLGWDIFGMQGDSTGLTLTSITIDGDEALGSTVNGGATPATVAAAVAAAINQNGYSATSTGGGYVIMAGPHGGNVQMTGTMANSTYILRLNPGWNASDQVSTVAAPVLAQQGVPGAYVDTDTFCERFHFPDVDFIRQLIVWCQYYCSINAQKIYVSGFSNGSRFAHRVARELPGICAIGSIGAGLMLTLVDTASEFKSTRNRAIPLWYGHGTGDTLALYGGNYPGTGQTTGDYVSFNVDSGGNPNAYYLNPVETCKEMVTAAGGGTNGSTTVYPEWYNDAFNTSYNVTKWRGASTNRVEVELWDLIDTGHSWPELVSNGDSLAYVTGDWAVDYLVIGKPNRQLSASLQILDFFSKFSLYHLYPRTRQTVSTRVGAGTRAGTATRKVAYRD